jgi:opacity protein-like surface antigen
MKKVLVIAVLTACMFNLVSAQENYKPRSGDFSIEVGFAPLGVNDVIVNDGALAGFIHFSDNLALRVGLGFGFSSEKQDNGETGASLNVGSGSTFRLSLEPGIVYSFKGTPRLAPYVGAGIGLGLLSTTAKSETNSNTTETTHPGGPDFDGDYVVFGLGVSTGFNYYIAKNLYLGAEVGLGFNFTSYPNQKDSNPAGKEKWSGADIGLNAYPLLRLGWTL